MADESDATRIHDEFELKATHDPQLGAVFVDRQAAEAAVNHLRASGLADEHLGIALHGADSHVFEGDVEAETVRGVERGVAIGAPIGALAGMTLLALVVPGVGAMGVGGILAAGGITGAIAGGFWGAYFGLKSEERVLEDEWDWERAPLEPGQVLVVVDQHGNPDESKRILEHHGGRMVAKPPHIR
jgi:outer membrane lipoprotein SlyB